MNQQKGLRILYVSDLAIVTTFGAMAYYTYAKGRIREAALCVVGLVALTAVVQILGYVFYGHGYVKYRVGPNRSRDLVVGLLALAMAGASIYVIFLGRPVVGIAGCL